MAEGWHERAINKKGSLSVADSEPFEERVKGIEPSPKAWEAVDGDQNCLKTKANSATLELACPTACPDSTTSLSVIGYSARENGRKAKARTSSRAACCSARDEQLLSVGIHVARDSVRELGSLDEPQLNERRFDVEASGGCVGRDAVGRPSSFTAVLAMLANLPLTDDEKAEAVRLLLAERSAFRSTVEA